MSSAESVSNAIVALQPTLTVDGTAFFVSEASTSASVTNDDGTETSSSAGSSGGLLPVVGAVAAGLVFIVLVLVLVRRRSRRKQTPKAHTAGSVTAAPVGFGVVHNPLYHHSGDSDNDDHGDGVARDGRGFENPVYEERESRVLSRLGFENSLYASGAGNPLFRDDANGRCGDAPAEDDMGGFYADLDGAEDAEVLYDEVGLPEYGEVDHMMAAGINPGASSGASTYATLTEAATGRYLDVGSDGTTYDKLASGSSRAPGEVEDPDDGYLDVHEGEEEEDYADLYGF